MTSNGEITGLVTQIVESLREQMRDGFESVQTQIESNKTETVGAIQRLTQAQNATAERVNVQNGRVASLERDKQRLAYEQAIRKEINDSRWLRIKWWAYAVVMIFAAAFGSFVYVFLQHVWR